MLAALIVGAVDACASASHAASEPEPDKPAARPVAAFGEDHPDCLEWTDGCIVCKRQEAGDPACSMPGVACLPAEPECRTTKP